MHFPATFSREYTKRSEWIFTPIIHLMVNKFVGITVEPKLPIALILKMNTLNKKLNRRSFVRRASLAAVTSLAFPSILPRSMMAATQKPRAVNPIRRGIRIGCIGVGNQGKGLMLQNYENVFAVCDVDATRRDAAKKEIEDRTGRPCPAYTDYRKLLENSELDAVMIATPDHWHALQTIHACQAGKHVYVEKPLSLVIDEGRLMVQAARKHQKIVQTGSMQRSMPGFREACEYVRSGRLGKMIEVKVGIPGVNYNEPAVSDSAPPPELDYELWLGPAPMRPYNKNHVHYNFRFFWDYSGGQMTNWGAHHLDIAQWGLDMDNSGPVEIEGRAEYDQAKRYEVPSASEIKYRYAKGVVMTLGQNMGANIPTGTTFIGEKGRIYVNRGKLTSDPEDILEKPLETDDVHLTLSKNHFDNWYESIKTGKLPICDVEIGHRSATVCHLGNIALRTGRKIKWDPVQERILNNDAAARMMRYSYRAPWKWPVI